MARLLSLLATLACDPQAGDPDDWAVRRQEPRPRPLKRSKPRYHQRKLRYGNFRGYPLPELFRWRQYRGWTQAYLAERADVAFATVNRLESGQTTAYEKTVYKLAKALRCTNADLMGRLPR